MSIPVDRRVEKKLQAKASSRGLTLEAYIEYLVTTDSMPVKSDKTVDLMIDLIQGMNHGASFGHTFYRHYVSLKPDTERLFWTRSLGQVSGDDYLEKRLQAVSI